MSAVLVAGKKSILTECEEYALCHSAGKRQKYYSDEQANMAKSLLGQEVYVQMVAGDEAQQETSKQSEISRKLRESHQVERLKLDKKKVEEMVLADMDQAKNKKPVERSDGRTRLFGDHIKMALCDAIQQAGLGGEFGRPLYLYLKFAPDLMARDKSKGGRAKALKQLEAIKKTNNLMDNKAKSKLSDFDLDNLAKFLVFNGLKQGGKGLLAFIDDQFEGRQQTHQAIRSEIAQIMKRASDNKAGL